MCNTLTVRLVKHHLVGGLMRSYPGGVVGDEAPVRVRWYGYTPTSYLGGIKTLRQEENCFDKGL